MAGKYKLTFFAKRNTPKVTSPKTKVKSTKATGKVVKTRRSNAKEEKILNKGKWLRVDSNGKTAGQKGYKGKKNKGNGPSKSARKKAVRNRRKRKK